MIAALASLLVCQLIGEILVRASSLPLPGPVAGMALLFGLLVWNGRRTGPEQAVPTELGRVSDALLANLSLLFIPAAVGVMQYLELLRSYAATIALAVTVSTVAALTVTALVFRAVVRLVTPALGTPTGPEDPR